MVHVEKPHADVEEDQVHAVTQTHLGVRGSGGQEDESQEKYTKERQEESRSRRSTDRFLRSFPHSLGGAVLVADLRGGGYNIDTRAKLPKI